MFTNTGETMTTSRWRSTVLGTGALCYATLMFVWFSVPAYLPNITQEFGMTQSQAGLLTGAIPLTYVPIALVSGAILDRIGAHRGIAFGVILFGVAQVSRASVTGFPQLLGLTMLVGVAGTTLTFGLPKLVSELYPPGDIGVPSSLYLLGSLLGTAAAFGLGRGYLGPLLGGWRPLFYASGFFAIALSLCWWLIVQYAPIHIWQTALNATRDPSDHPSIRTNIRIVLGNAPLRLLLVVGFVYLMVLHGLQNWLPTLFQHRGLSPQHAAFTASAFVGLEALGVLIIPALSDRTGQRGMFIAGAGGICAAGTAALLIPDAPLSLAVLGVLIAGFGIGGLAPLVRMVPPELDDIGPELTGTATGFVFAVGEFGGFLGPFLIGYLQDSTGLYTPGLAVLTAGCLLVVLAGRRVPV